jgi:choline-sulfatase
MIRSEIDTASLWREKMKRRQFIAATAAGAAALILDGKSSAAESPAQDSRPNILFIMTDQQHAGMMSCAGNKWLKTPAMDRLAASGIRFERAYACNPVCVPNRFSFQTGLMPSAIGMSHNGDSREATVTELMLEQSLGRLFKRAGYETVYGGKVHLPRKMKGIENLGYRNLTGDSRQGLADACAEFIKSKHTKPFFLTASFINPHDICYMAINDFNRTRGQPPVGNTDSKTCEATLDRARNAGDIDSFVRRHCPPLPANHEVPASEPKCITEKYTEARPFRAHARKNWTENQWRLHRWAYCRLTEMVDAEIATVLDALRDAGLEDSTLVVFTSDHGDMDSAHRMEHKSVLYEEAVRVPFVMSYKGVIPGGKVDYTHLVSNGLDLLPTLCDYARIEPPRGLHGRSLRTLAEGGTSGKWRDFVVCESQNGRSLRTDRFKYSIYDSGKNREQLIDLQSDPGEMDNLAGRADFESTLNEHRRLLRGWVRRTGDKIAARYVDVES